VDRDYIALAFFLLLLPQLASGAGAVVSTGTCTATVINSWQDNSGNSVVALHFVTNTQTFDINDPVPLGAPPTQVPDFVAGICNNLANQAVAFSTVPAAGEVIVPTPPATVVPDPNAAIKNQFQQDYLVLRQCKALINNAVLSAADTTCVAQQTTVNAEFAANRAILLPLVPAGP